MGSSVGWLRTRQAPAVRICCVNDMHLEILPVTPRWRLRTGKCPLHQRRPAAPLLPPALPLQNLSAAAAPVGGEDANPGQRKPSTVPHSATTDQDSRASPAEVHQVADSHWENSNKLTLSRFGTSAAVSARASRLQKLYSYLLVHLVEFVLQLVHALISFLGDLRCRLAQLLQLLACLPGRLLFGPLERSHLRLLRRQLLATDVLC